jgi:serine protease Do
MQASRATRAIRFGLAVMLVAADLPPTAAAPKPRSGASAAPLCAGRYADALSAMRAAVRQRESRSSADWVYCLRATAIYEHVSYGRGGRLRRQYHRKTRHGTGFAYRRRGDDWLLATNRHVIEFPEVTGDGVELEGVPPGARKVREEVRIVASEADPDRSDLPLLSERVSDLALDLAVLSTRTPLHLMPYRLGRSADLRVGNAVLARGYPLGAFPAANTWKVIGTGQRDLERGWDHEDFAVDALLNLGSSGSPVLAIDCATGEPELVGIYHAGYRGAQGLNVVVAIDQLRDVLVELRVTSRGPAPAEPPPDPVALRAAVARGPTVIPFGGRAVRVERDGDGLRFALLDAAYPLSTHAEVALVDRPGSAGDGPATELRDALRAQLALVLAWRAAEPKAGGDSRMVMERLAGRMKEREEEQGDLLAAVETGAAPIAEVTQGERSAAAGRASDGARMPHAGGPELIRLAP